MKKSSLRFTIGAKLTTLFVCFWVIGSSVLVLLSYIEFKKELHENIQIRVKDYVSLGILDFPSDVHATLDVSSSQDSPEYKRVVKRLREIKANSTDIIYVYTFRKMQNGDVIFVTDAESDPDLHSQIGDVYEDSTDVLLEALKGADKIHVEREFSSDKWGRFLSAYAPIFTSEGRFDGVLGVDISYERVKEMLVAHFLKLFISFIVSSLVVIISIIVFSKRIVAPIKKCVEFVGYLAEGNYTNDVPDSFCKRRDEVGDLMRAYRTLEDNTRHLLVSIKEQAGIISDLGKDIYTSTDQTSKEIKRIVLNISTVKDETEDQNKCVNDAISTMDEISKGVDKLNKLIERQSVNVRESSSAIEQMMASISSVTSTLVRNAENIKNLSISSESGRSDLNSVVTDIMKVAKQSEGLLEISQVIQNIASQTNLLSMNASIEAAHAGEAGKGFIVVAEEIRKLAESSGEQAQTVSNVLTNIKESIERITQSTENILEKFSLIESEVKIVSEQENAIRNSMEEQSVGNQQVLEAIASLNEITSRVRTDSLEMHKGSKQVISESTTLSIISEDIATRMGDMALASSHINEALAKINSLTAKNKETLKHLDEDVGKFQV
ncbi:MAG: hypothetical protein JXR63_08795 [Spirochaetales bacterium]|nr:hypothetical protein [Spirochaetales bacterium]